MAIKRKHKAKKNPARYTKAPKTRSAAKKFLDFSGRSRVNETSTQINTSQKFVFIGSCPEINYVSDKKDGKKRLYKHPLKKHGKWLVAADGTFAIVTGLSLNIKPEGLVG